ncbi:preprotein translocase subunit SecY [Mesomycoplasma hyopneumoniae]|uniref:Protein translocase subunit SecY n=6 Tax=Mesomycoplasma hyopneumoniae TaxID=2099 RepID=A0A223M9U9_MESHO|nr:preprotein translocase subunit SecY [Mesomycoplasma hyopneumoniae]AAV27463.1 preprotein translocase secy subunit [Mesomycoplasma hyopneumoniae 232]AAZ44262.1 preprotein translocase SecY subunit [Mesomycoplasma hyopneumoniae J]AAZ53549.1 preprotein translocase SecY subunit [Mesomycoplasma hyopneumoniae 7448]ADQ90345.2 Preprotein translocase SecY subunit [Mesomycoplasma hyopneumoniae 168]AGM21910.1 Preprotein translocase SecY subunit [Mesomycoplasma hyopneumoniae 168-L]
MLKLLAKVWLGINSAYVSLKNRAYFAYREKILARKLIFTFFLLVIFIVCGTITIPGLKLLQFQLDSNSFLGIINTVGGGGLLNFSVVALGISPFITASLFMLIAQTKLFPPIHRLSQSGPAGRRKINIITRFLTLLVAVIQAVVLIRTVILNPDYGFVRLEINTPVFIWLVLPLVLVAGSLFSLFLAEQITDKGVGNGTSLLIFSGIVVGLPRRFQHAFEYLVDLSFSSSLISQVLSFILYIFGFLLILLIAIYVYLAERKIPIQQTGSGMSKNIKEISILPLKLNPAGIMPVIFALIIVSLPTLFSGFLDRNTSAVRNWIDNNMQIYHPIGLIIFIVFNVSFSIIMSLQQSRVDKIAQDFAKNSTFIPGIRPGEQTEDYLISVVLRLSVFSAIYLTFLGILQPVEIMLGLPSAITISGTSIIILATTTLETISQIKARYDAQKVLKQSKKIRKNLQVRKNSPSIDSNQDLLW